MLPGASVSGDAGSEALGWTGAGASAWPDVAHSGKKPRDTILDTWPRVALLPGRKVPSE